MKLSVIVPTYNSAATIADLLDSFDRQQGFESWELVVADNGSTDDTLAILRSYQQQLPNLTIVDASQKRGAAYARNRGVDASKAPSLAFCDADDVVDRGWVRSIARALDRYDFVAGRLDPGEINDSSVKELRACPQQEGLQEYRYPPYLPHAASCNLGVRAHIHHAVGGFDENLFKLEDTDYCWRIQLAGTQLHFVPDAVVHYRLRSSVRETLRQAREWGEHNVALYKRYRPLGMPKLSWRQGANGWYLLLRQMIRLRRRPQVVRWLWRVTWRVGRIQGSIKHRVVAL